MDDVAQGFPRTGSPRRLSEILPPISTSIPKPQPAHSATTGQQFPAQRDAKPIGLPHGATGAGAMQTTAERQPEVARVFGLPPSATSLARSLGRLISWQDASIYSGDEFAGVSIKNVAVRPGFDLAEVQRHAAAVERLCEPAGTDLATQKLTELRALTAHRAKGDGDMVLTAVAYTQRLAQYPADVVAAACDGWADREQWWPSWAELKAEADKRMRGRLQIRETLRRFR